MPSHSIKTAETPYILAESKGDVIPKSVFFSTVPYYNLYEMLQLPV